ncbi:META domain-containing protein [Pontibacter sp. XAAS-A31]|nr:META domain-containing protein [Pontibacter harenae]
MFGENLTNLYFSLATFDAGKKKGKLEVHTIGSTRKGGPDSYLAFDTYYLEKLSKATSFTINDGILIVNTADGDMLVYKR